MSSSRAGASFSRGFKIAATAAGTTVFLAGGFYTFVEVVSPSLRYARERDAVGDGAFVDKSIHIGSLTSAATLAKANTEMFGGFLTASRVDAAVERAVREKQIDASVLQAELRKEEVTNLANAQVKQTEATSAAAVRQTEATSAAAVKQTQAYAMAGAISVVAVAIAAYLLTLLRSK